MQNEIFRNKWNSYVLISLIGIFAGLLVAFFSLFPSDDLWGLANFSSGTLAFWIWTSSLIALFSSSHYVAGVHVSLYIYFMFYVTGIFKRLAIVNSGYNTDSYFYEGLWLELKYGLLPALICFFLAFFLWYGRKNNIFCRILRFAPLMVILLEAIGCWWAVINNHQNLFMAIVDSICSVTYPLIILKFSACRNTAS